MGGRDTDHVLELLSSVDLFEGLDRKHLKMVRGLCREHSFDAGMVIVEVGANDKRFFLLLEGTADIFNGDRYAKSVGPGGYFGEVSVLDGGPRTASIKTATAVHAVSIASFNLKALLRENPAMAVKLLEALCGRLRTLTGASTS